MINIYRTVGSTGAAELATALNDASIPARRVRNEANLRMRPNLDRLICWGSVPSTLPSGVASLNSTPLHSKLSDALRLRGAGVETIEVSQTRIAPTPVSRGTYQPPPGPWEAARVVEVMGELDRWLSRPLPPSVEWLPRSNSHTGGGDLLTPPTQPDFYSRRENLVREYRVHSFLGKSIRAGVKTPRVGVEPHQWIRSHDAGWGINYTGFASTRPMRRLARAAITALELDFGAVDIGERADGTLLVLEVNRAPGVEDGTVNSYVNAIRRWVGMEIESGD